MGRPLPQGAFHEGSGDSPGAVVTALHGEAALLRDFHLWEGTRAVPPTEAYPAARDAIPERTIILFDGLPGAGKSTHIEWLRTALGAEWLSMARFAEARGVSQHERRERQLHLGQLHPADEAFLSAVAAARGRFVLVEKFCRTPVEAQALVDRAVAAGWQLFQIHVCFPTDPVGASIGRQLERGARRGKAAPGPEEARRRALTHLARGSSGRWALRALGVPVHRVDSTRTQEENAQEIRAALGLSFDALDWEVEPLRELEEVTRRTGIAAWVGGGTLYKPFWNGRFGPAQRPTDVDVAVDAQAEVAPLLDALERRFPRRRWSVLCPSERLRRRRGVLTSGAREASALAPFLHRAGLVRWDGERVEVWLAAGAEASLRGGLVQLNARLLDALAESERAPALAAAADRLALVVRDYPGLVIDPASAARLGPPFDAHRPTRIATAWRPLKEAALRAQLGGRRAAWCRRALTREERVIAEQILRFHQESDHRANAPERPARAPLPRPLEAIRRARVRDKAGLNLATRERAHLVRGTVAPPDGFASWFHYLGLEAEDATFRDWFLDQVHHRAPVGGADPLVRGVMDHSLFASRLPHPSRAQSPMHQGWPLERHLSAAVLELRTDPLARVHPGSPGGLRPAELRLSARMAMLFHDTGKLAGPREPRRHARIGALLWLQHRPAWFPRHLVEPVRWMVETHDLFGAFGRGLTDKRARAPADYAVDLALDTSYYGALDSQAVRQKLAESGWPLQLAVAVNKALWRADVGAIPALRWLLPAADLVERLILLPNQGKKIARERRRHR